MLNKFYDWFTKDTDNRLVSWYDNLDEYSQIFLSLAIAFAGLVLIVFSIFAAHNF